MGHHIRGQRRATPAIEIEAVESRLLMSTNVPVDTPFQANQFTAGGQSMGFGANNSIAADAGGNFVAVWGSSQQGGYMARLFAADGTPRAAEFRVNTAAIGTVPSGGYDVAMEPDGDFVVAWQGEVRQGNRVVGSQVIAQRFDAAGNRRGPELPSRGSFPSLAMDDAGRFVVSYTAAEIAKNASEGVYARRYDANGNVLPTPYASTGTLAGEFRVNTYSPGQQRDSAMAMDADGDFVATWYSLDQDGGGWGVYGQRFNGAGVKQGAEFRVSQATAGNQLYPSVSADAAGNFVVAWRDGVYVGDSSTTPNNIYFRRYAADGTALSGDTVANLTSGVEHGWPNVSVDPATGAFAVTWLKDRGNNYVFDSGYLRQYDAAGNPEGDPIDPGGSATAVAWQPGGKFVAALDNPDASGGGVFVQRYDPAPAPVVTPSALSETRVDDASADSITEQILL